MLMKNKMNRMKYLLTTLSSPQNHPHTNYTRQRSIAIKPRFKSSIKIKKITSRFNDKKQFVDFRIVKELDEETGLYYYGARYLDPRTSRWLTGDPAIYQGDYIPVAPINDDARKHNQNLPGMGGIFNIVNMHAYHYAGNNPVKYVDPDGRRLGLAVDILRNSMNLRSETRHVLSEGLINGIYTAEARRMNIIRSFADSTGRSNTIGRGQVSQAAYNDVLENFGDELSTYCRLLGIEYSGDYRTDMSNGQLEDFIVTGYLALNVDRSLQTEGRTAEDALKIGIGLYKGARPTIVNAQRESGDVVTFSGIESVLQNGNRRQKDVLNYINEVYDSR